MTSAALWMRLGANRRVRSEMTSTQTLAYGARRRTRRWRAVVLFTGLSIVLGLADRYGKAVLNQANVVVRQRACLAYVAPAAAVVFAYPNVSAATPVPVAVADMSGIAVPSPKADPACGLFAGGNVLFAGLLSNHNGRRLVIVECGMHPATSDGFWGEGISLVARVIRPGSFKSRPVELSAEVVCPMPKLYANEHGSVFNPGAAVVFAGQIDPAHATDFVAAFNAKGEAGTLRGHLRDDDTLTIDDESPLNVWATLEPCMLPNVN